MSKKSFMGSGQNPNSRKGLSNIQLAQPDGSTRPVAEATKGNLRSLKHGAYSERKLSPRVKLKEKELVKFLDEVPYICSVDRLIVRNLARCLARLEAFDSYLDETGEIIKVAGNPKLSPILPVYFTAIESARRHCEALGLTPSERAKLGVDLAKYQDIAERMAERDKQNDQR